MKKTNEDFKADLSSNTKWTVAVQTVEALAVAADNMNQSSSTPLDERMIAAAMMIKAAAILHGRSVVEIQDWVVGQVRGGKALEELLNAAPVGNA